MPSAPQTATALQTTTTPEPTQAVSRITPVIAPESRPAPPAGPTQRERDLAYIERSPAKDTPEAKQVEVLLEKYGWDRSALPAAYQYAYARDQALRQMGAALQQAGASTNLDEAGRYHLDAVMLGQRERLEKYGPLTETFMEDLHAIHPTVFFGHPDRGGKPVIPPK